MTHPTQAPAILTISVSRPRGILRTLVFWVQRARSRKDLAKLTDAQLWDCGLTRLDIETECAKPFWQD